MADKKPAPKTITSRKPKVTETSPVADQGWPKYGYGYEPEGGEPTPVPPITRTPAEDEDGEG